MAWNTATSYAGGYLPTNADFNGIGNDLRTHGGDVNVNGYKLSGIGSWTSTGQPRANATSSGSTSLPSGVYTPVALNIDIITPIGITRSGGVFTVPTAGVYLCSGVAAINPSGGGQYRSAQWYKNGITTNVAAAVTPSASSAGFYFIAMPSFPFSLNAGESIALWAFQDSGSPVGTTAGFCFVSIFQLA